MTILGLPLPMFLVFAATLLAGSLGAIHFLVVHIWLARPIREITPPRVADASGGAAADAEAGGRGA